MKVLAICIKTYINENDLQMFLDDEIEVLTKNSLFIKGKEYYVIKEYYNKKYFKLITK